jgi:putative ABC transport system permease protein
VRVLGFTRGEVSYILLGELAIFTLAALPVGFLVGTGLCAYFIQSLTTDLFRIPLVIQNSTYSFAALVVVVCSIVSGLVVRRRIDRLDLVGVLKTRE